MFGMEDGTLIKRPNGLTDGIFDLFRVLQKVNVSNLFLKCLQMPNTCVVPIMLSQWVGKRI